MRIASLAVLLAALCSVRAQAQSGPYQVAAPATVALRLTSQAPAPQLTLPSHTDLLAARRFNSHAPGATLMIIGGAAVVGGILVGGSGGFVLILGGVAVGAYGFYLYNR